MAAAAAVLLALVLCFVGSASAACRMRLEVLEPNSTVVFKGYSTYSTVNSGKSQFPISLFDSNTTVGLSGAMYIQSEALKDCPETAEGWAEAAPQLVITSAPNPYIYQPLVVYPDTLLAGVMGVPLNFSNLAMNLTLGPSSDASAAAAAPRKAAGGSAAGPVAMELAATIMDGYSFSNTSFTGGAKLDAMRNQTYNGLSNAEFRVRAGGLAAFGM